MPAGSKGGGSQVLKTVGVGVASHNKWYPQVGPDGRVSPEAIQESFMGASNDAAKGGLRTLQQVGIDVSRMTPQNRAAFLLASELSYQAGTEHLGWTSKGEQP